MIGRRQDAIWQHFTKLKENNKPIRAKCKHCKKEMCSLVARMKLHIHKCNSINVNKDEICDQLELDDIDYNNESLEVMNQTEKQNCSQNKRIKVIDPVENIAQSSVSSSISSSLSTSSEIANSKLDSFIRKTTKMESKNIDLQIAKFIYSTNSSFQHVEHKEFKKMINLLRPGYKPPTCHEIANELLNEVYLSVRQNIEKDLKGKIVSMVMAGWSNLHVEPIICISVTDISEGNIHLIDTIHTAENRHTADYLLHLAVTAIKSCQKFGCFVKSFVTDNASNMTKMRKQLSQREDLAMPDIITYGCSVHILNLLGKDIDVPGLKDDIKEIIKYFKYTHFPAAKYKQAGGTSLNLPIDVRWNTLSDCFESYLKNWHILVKVCTENRISIDTEIYAKVQNIDLKNKVEKYLFKLQKISSALDKAQNETCTIAEVTEIWIDLLQSVEKENFTIFEIDCFKTRFNMAMTSFHYLANLLDHRYRGQKLSQSQAEEALEYAAAYHPEAMPFIILYQAQSSPFRKYLFLTQNMNNVHPVSWWCALRNSINDAMFDLSMQLHTAVASSAGIERLFPTFGLVHSKIRNRLGTEKASKLVSIMTTLNSNSIILNDD